MSGSPIKPPHRNTSHHVAPCLHSPSHPIVPTADKNVLCDACINLTLSEQKRKYAQIQRLKEIEEAKAINARIMMEQQKQKESEQLKRKVERETMKLNVSPPKTANIQRREQSAIIDEKVEERKKRRASQNAYRLELDKQIANKSKAKTAMISTSLQGFNEADNAKKEKLQQQVKESWIEDINKKSKTIKPKEEPMGNIFDNQGKTQKINLSSDYDRAIQLKKENKKIEAMKDKEYMNTIINNCTQQKRMDTESKHKHRQTCKQIEQYQQDQAKSIITRNQLFRKSLYDWGDHCQTDACNCINCSKCHRPITMTLA